MTTTRTFTLRRKVTFAVLALALAVSTVVLMADQAGAHQATLTVRTTCQDNGWRANWSISNSESAKTMVIMSEDVTEFAPNPTPFSGTSIDSTDHAFEVDAVTATVTVDWVQHEPLTYSATAQRPEACVVPPTTTTTVPPTTTTAPPPPPSDTVPPEIDTQVMVRQPDVYVGELPRTGTGTGPLAAVGFGLVAAGLLLLAARRRIA